ncbi:MAG TPA: flagellar hook capping FlgD N-terminal domain-containing protein [Terracidiphilus sp.]|nr:flagellar hook capping FlgD N-terminal domain-containing protein [Terracidiphilus sp.]
MVQSAGIFAHTAQAAQALSSAAPTASDSSSNGSSSSDSATISANDFLTLLVTEMQNQDPTQATDPNEYINQLVNVNSLEQLISINQNLSTALGVTPTGSSTGSSRGSNAPAAQSASSSAPAATGAHALNLLHGLSQTDGNLSVPSASPAALRVASALNGRPAA